MSINVITSSGRANLESKSISLTSTSTQTYAPSSGMDGFSSVSVTPNLQTKYVTPSSQSQLITPSSGYCRLKNVTVSGDSNLIASNIRRRYSIFDVVGTFSGRRGDFFTTSKFSVSFTSDSLTLDTSILDIRSEEDIHTIAIWPNYTITSINGYISFWVYSIEMIKHDCIYTLGGDSEIYYADIKGTGAISVNYSDSQITITLPNYEFDGGQYCYIIAKY